jgi:glycosyltransferase involved in cell wall biosynthesis
VHGESTTELRLKVSVILPCYRAGTIAASSAVQLRQVLSEHFDDWEILIVDDGGDDIPNSIEVNPKLRILRLPKNCGKGAAVRVGMKAATGDVRIFTDVDLPYGTAPIVAAVRYIRKCGFHVVIGDRTLPGALYTQRLAIGRRVASGVFSSFVGRLVTGGFFDTQCGLKAFRGDVAAALFGVSRIDRFAFDVELVYVCLKHRLDIKRIPVNLVNNTTSTVRLFRDSIRGFVDVLRIKTHQMRGHYQSNRLDEIVWEDYQNSANPG